MTDQLSLHTQIFAELVPGADPVPVDIIATSAQELLDTVRTLNGGDPQLAQPTPTQPAAQPAPQPEAQQPQPTAQPGPSAAATAPESAATPSATETPAQPSQPEVTLNDVLAPARTLLQQPNGEDTLRQILAQHGAQAISQADPAKFPAIKAAIEQALAQ